MSFKIQNPRPFVKGLFRALLGACARVEMLAAADTTRHQPRRGNGGPLDNLARRQRAAIERMVPPGLIDLGDLAPTGAASESLSSRVQLPSLGLSFVDDGCFHWP